MLAIVIPYYKFEFFHKTLDSLANQTNKKFQVYIGDDASPDNPNNILKEFTDIIDITYKRYEENLGSISLVTHWKRCIDLTQDEDWILILGDDDVLEENVVELWYNKLSEFEDKANVIRFASQKINENSTAYSQIFQHPIFQSPAESYYRRFKGWTRSSLSEHIFRKESFKKYGFYNYPLGWHSDDRAWLEFSENKPIFTINEALIYVRISPLSISGRNDQGELKREATIKFYRYLVYNKLPLFQLDQRIYLLRAYRNLLKKTNNFTLKEKFYLAAIYFKYTKPHIVKKCKIFYIKGL